MGQNSGFAGTFLLEKKKERNKLWGFLFLSQMVIPRNFFFKNKLSPFCQITVNTSVAVHLFKTRPKFEKIGTFCTIMRELAK